MARPAAAPVQRNALAPGLLAAALLFLSPVAMAGGWFTVVLYSTAILGAIVAWFAGQARQWWWVAVFAVIVVIWNPILPLPFSGGVWIAAQIAAAIAFLVAGALITTRPRS